jgi:2-polyprenyl-3-methyl-5-hydroxy-6-metoxy-1,4-benzoquinol methylase
MPKLILNKPCTLCGALDARHCVTLNKKPACETDYGIPPQNYTRNIFQCNNCDVFFNNQDLLPDSFYQGDYNDRTYGERWNARFEFIMSLPFEKSDNKQRCARIHDFLLKKGNIPHQTKVLDIGSGLGVFSAEMNNHNYLTHIVDPDQKSVEHALNVIGVREAWQGSVLEIDKYLGEKKFDFISLNKVLEHVPSPLHALSSLQAYLHDCGIVYVELPDGEAAEEFDSTFESQEFCIEHLTVFGSKSISWLVENAGFTTLKIDRVHEPSGKFSIYAFLYNVN